MRSVEAIKGGRYYTPNRQGLYAVASKHAKRAINTIAELLDSKNEAIRLGAARSILDKCLPDVKAMTIEPKTYEPIKITLIEEGQS